MRSRAVPAAVTLALGLAAAGLGLGYASPSPHAQPAAEIAERAREAGDPQTGAHAGGAGSTRRALAQADERADSPAADDLARDIESVLSDVPSVLDDARVGIAITDLHRGRVLYEREANGAFNVASNSKIITTAAALAYLGPDFRFQTALYGEEVDADGVIPGDLYLRSTGDPYLDTGDLRKLVDELVRRGVRRVDGGVVVDDRAFDDETSPPHFDEFEEPSDEHASYRPPVGAASLNFNTITVAAAPHPEGRGAASVSIDPPTAYAELGGRVATVRRGRTRVRVTPRVTDDGMHLAVSGQVRAGRVHSQRSRIAHPAEYAGGTLLALLAERGLDVEEPEVRRGAVPRGAEALALHQSLPLAVIVRSLGKYSNNHVAETLLKTLGAEIVARGRPATWDDGLAVVREYLEDEVGLEPGSYRYDNGSGLFDASAFSPQDIVAVLATAHRDYQYGSELKSSLAVAGVDGTMRRRLSRGPGERVVRAKTGTLMNVSALSGYAAVDSREPLAFSILMDGVPRRGRRDARDLQDDIAGAIVTYLRRHER